MRLTRRGGRREREHIISNRKKKNRKWHRPNLHEKEMYGGVHAVLTSTPTITMLMLRYVAVSADRQHHFVNTSIYYYDTTIVVLLVREVLWYNTDIVVWSGIFVQQYMYATDDRAQKVSEYVRRLSRFCGEWVNRWGAERETTTILLLHYCCVWTVNFRCSLEAVRHAWQSEYVRRYDREHVATSQNGKMPSERGKPRNTPDGRVKSTWDTVPTMIWYYYCTLLYRSCWRDNYI